MLFFAANAESLWFRHFFTPRFYFEVNLTKLAGTTTLLFMAITGRAASLNGFAVGNAWALKGYFQAVLFVQGPFYGSQVQFTLAAQYLLAQFTAVLQRYGRVLALQLPQYINDLFLVPLIVRYHGFCDARFRKCNRFNGYCFPWLVERIIGFCVF